MGDPAYLEVAAAFSGVGLAAVGIYLTVLSGYLIVAYIVGARLSASQLVIINSLFLVFEAGIIFVIHSNSRASYLAALASQGGSGAIIEVSAVGVWITTAVLAIGLGAALKFMHDIRSQKKDA